MINKIALAGCGNVGTALLEILHEKKEELKEKYGFEYKVVFITDLIKGTVMDKNGLPLSALLDAVHARKKFTECAECVQCACTGTFDELLEASGATVLAECTPTNYETGEPGLSHFRAALSRGISVTTTNKGPLSVAYDELHALARANNAHLAYEGVVMSGTPLLDMIRNGIAGCSVLGFEGILNGTTNYMLTQMTQAGASYADALSEAQALGYAEANPAGDVEGWDAAVKVVVLAKIIYGKDLSINDVDRTGITGVTQQQIGTAKTHNAVIKLTAGIKFDETGTMHPFVAPREMPLTHPLASINGGINAVTLTTDNLGDITLIGPGAGRRETGQALLGDILRMSTGR